MLAFQHVIKTGGSTRACHLRKHLLDRFYDADLKVGNQGQATIIMGHDIRTGQFDRTVVFLRHPADWLVSVYHHNMARRGPLYDQPFDRWYEDMQKDLVCTVPVGRRNRLSSWIQQKFGDPVETLERAWFVGLQETMALDYGLICDYLRIPSDWEDKRVAGAWDEFDQCRIPKVYTLTEEMRHRIEAENKGDMQLYERAQRLRAQSILALLTTLEKRGE